jgi:hypothetical protein
MDLIALSGVFGILVGLFLFCYFFIALGRIWMYSKQQTLLLRELCELQRNAIPSKSGTSGATFSNNEDRTEGACDGVFCHHCGATVSAEAPQCIACGKSLID